MATHVEGYPERHTARNLWVTVGVLVLLALAIVTGVAIGRATVDEPAPAPVPEGLATAAVVQTIDASIAATVAGDEAALAAMWAPEGVMTDDIAGIETVGATEIAATYAGGEITSLERTSEVIQVGDLAANAVSYVAAGGGGQGIAVFELDDGGLITHQWVVGT